MAARLTDEDRRLRALSEQEFRDQVTDVARLTGWEWMFVKPLRAAGGIWKTPTFGTLGKGWPDTVFIRGRDARIVFVEFKRELGKVEPDQQRVHDRLRSAGFEVYVWRPSDFDRIVEVLR
jgi:VRR-NUC domain-containing protein